MMQFQVCRENDEASETSQDQESIAVDARSWTIAVDPIMPERPRSH